MVRACIYLKSPFWRYQVNNLGNFSKKHFFRYSFHRFRVRDKRLFLKLEKYGISGKILEWIEAFLKNRRQRVVLAEKYIWLERNFSVIEPIIFIIYINFLSNMLSCVIKMYADDTKILSRIYETVMLSKILKICEKTSINSSVEETLN